MVSTSDPSTDRTDTTRPGDDPSMDPSVEGWVVDLATRRVVRRAPKACEDQAAGARKEAPGAGKQ